MSRREVSDIIRELFGFKVTCFGSSGHGMSGGMSFKREAGCGRGLRLWGMGSEGIINNHGH